MIYLDNAATSHPKAPGVAAAVARCLEEGTCSPGRGSHPLALAASHCFLKPGQPAPHCWAWPGRSA